MEKTDQAEAPAPATAGHDVSSNASKDVDVGIPEADYSSKATNKTSFSDYLVPSPPCLNQTGRSPDRGYRGCFRIQPSLKG